MGKGYLADTSAVIKYLNNSFPASANLLLDNIFDSGFYISIISKIELLAWNAIDKEVYNVLRQFVDMAVIINIDDNICNLAIDIRKNVKVRLPDVVIAATAINNGLTLLADNDKDFLKIGEKYTGLVYTNPFKM